jgi:DNA-binding GntR family transcriptional regulator
VSAPGGSETDALYEHNDREHRAIIAALSAGDATGARALAGEHVLHSYELPLHVLEQRPRNGITSVASGRSASA